MRICVCQSAMTFLEIGNSLGMSEKSAKESFHRGMKKLRKLSVAELAPVVEYVSAARALADRIDDFKGFEE